MTWGLADIKSAYEKGERQGASHMIVAWDSFDNLNYPIYVMPGEDPRDRMPKNGDSVDECYRYSLGWESQSKEGRARHFEYDASVVEEPKITSAAEVKITTRIVLKHGIMLPYTIPAHPSLNIEEKSGETFVSLADLESLEDTDSFSRQVTGFSSFGEHALIDAGWARKTSRGGMYATEAYLEREDGKSIFGEVIDRFETVWDAEKGDNRPLAIWRSMTEEEREFIAQLVRDIDYGKTVARGSE